MKRVLIIGGTRSIGRQVIAQLTAMGTAQVRRAGA
jgi:putative cell wall-binding protein